jgi:hypothetical protein
VGAAGEGGGRVGELEEEMALESMKGGGEGGKVHCQSGRVSEGDYS